MADDEDKLVTKPFKFVTGLCYNSITIGLHAILEMLTRSQLVRNRSLSVQISITPEILAEAQNNSSVLHLSTFVLICLIPKALMPGFPIRTSRLFRLFTNHLWR